MKLNLKVNDIIEIENEKYQIRLSDNEVDLLLIPLDEEGNEIEVEEII